jgi:hypothetical protein
VRHSHAIARLAPRDQLGPSTRRPIGICQAPCRLSGLHGQVHPEQSVRGRGGRDKVSEATFFGVRYRIQGRLLRLYNESYMDSAGYQPRSCGIAGAVARRTPRRMWCCSGGRSAELISRAVGNWCTRYIGAHPTRQGARAQRAPPVGCAHAQ